MRVKNNTQHTNCVACFLGGKGDDYLNSLTETVVPKVTELFGARALGVYHLFVERKLG